MLSIRRVVCLAALCLSLLLQPSAFAAQAFGPILLSEYEFVPKVSTLHVTGGFAGVDQTYNIEGGFLFASGLDQTYERVDDHFVISLVPFGDFNQVDATAFSSVNGSFDLDRALNLTGLTGTYEPGLPNAFNFTGVDGQGAPIHLNVQRKGDWLHISGANRPGCCDFFNYEIDAFARLVPFQSRDRRRSGGGGVTTAAIPEPGSLAVLGLGTLVLARRRRGHA